jgi:hypothetical protein
MSIAGSFSLLTELSQVAPLRRLSALESNEASERSSPGVDVAWLRRREKDFHLQAVDHAPHTKKIQAA